MKTWWLLLFFFVTPVQARVGDAAVVKIYSGLAGAAPLFFGSGLLVKSGADIFVLTSDHVTARENGSYVHTAYNELTGKLRITWLMSDWGRGFALLQVNEAAKLAHLLSDLPDLSELNQNLPMGPVELAGFPAKSLSLIRTGGERVGGYAGTPLFKQSTELEVVEKTQAEYGMSGGVMTSPGGEIPLGLLSHQQLDPQGVSAAGIVIPYWELYPCLHAILVEQNFSCWNFQESTESAVSRDSVFLRSGPLQINFSWVNVENFSDIHFTIARRPSPGSLATTPLLNELYAKLMWRETHAHLDSQTPNSLSLIGWRRAGTFGAWSTMRERSLLAVLQRLDQHADEPVFVQSYSDYDDVREIARNAKLKFLGALRRFQGEGLLARAAIDLAEALDVDPNSIPTQSDSWLGISPRALKALINDPQLTAEWRSPGAPELRTALQGLAEAFADVTL